MYPLQECMTNHIECSQSVTMLLLVSVNHRPLGLSHQGADATNPAQVSYSGNQGQEGSSHWQAEPAGQWPYCSHCQIFKSQGGLSLSLPCQTLVCATLHVVIVTYSIFLTAFSLLCCLFDLPHSHMEQLTVTHQILFILRRNNLHGTDNVLLTVHLMII